MRLAIKIFVNADKKADKSYILIKNEQNFYFLASQAVIGCFISISTNFQIIGSCYYYVYIYIFYFSVQVTICQQCLFMDLCWYFHNSPWGFNIKYNCLGQCCPCLWPQHLNLHFTSTFIESIISSLAIHKKAPMRYFSEFLCLKRAFNLCLC